MLGIQIILTVIAAAAILRVFSQFKAGNVKRVWFFAWALFWIAVIVVTFLPQTTQMLADVLGVGRGVDVVTYVSFAALFFMVYKLFVKIESLEREISQLVRKLALDEKKEKE